MFNDRIPFNSQMLATIVRHPVGVVEKALKAFIDLGLVEIMNNGAIYMLDIQNFIGETSTEADRKKVYRAKISSEKETLKLVGQMSGQTSDVRTPEIELEKERKKEKELEKDIVEENFIFPDYLSEKAVDQIKKGNPKNYKLRFPIAYLNQVTEKNFQFVEKNTKLINSRLLEGYKLEDFKTVVDIKFDEWKGTEMAKYIRPETLFGTKFDGYLNQIPVNQTNKNYVDDGLDLPF